MPPADSINPGIGFDVALKVDVRPLSDPGRVQVRTELQRDHRDIWETKETRKQ